MVITIPVSIKKHSKMTQSYKQYEQFRDNYLRTLVQDVLHKGGKRILTKYLVEINKKLNLGIKTGHPETLKQRICEKTIRNSHLSCSGCKTIGHFYGQQGCEKFKNNICRRCNTKGHWDAKCNNCTRCGYFGHDNTNCNRTTHRNGSALN